MNRSLLHAYFAILAVTFGIFAIPLTVFAGSRYERCRATLQPDGLAGLPASEIPNECAKQLATHMVLVIGVAALTATVLAGVLIFPFMAITAWRQSNRVKLSGGVGHGS